MLYGKLTGVDYSTSIFARVMVIPSKLVGVDYSTYLIAFYSNYMLYHPIGAPLSMITPTNSQARPSML